MEPHVFFENRRSKTGVLALIAFEGEVTRRFGDLRFLMLARFEGSVVPWGGRGVCVFSRIPIIFIYNDKGEIETLPTLRLRDSFLGPRPPSDLPQQKSPWFDLWKDRSSGIR
jgi:hypothetical protein